MEGQLGVPLRDLRRSWYLLILLRLYENTLGSLGQSGNMGRARGSLVLSVSKILSKISHLYEVNLCLSSILKKKKKIRSTVLFG